MFCINFLIARRRQKTICERRGGKGMGIGGERILLLKRKEAWCPFFSYFMAHFGPQPSTEGNRSSPDLSYQSLGIRRSRPLKFDPTATIIITFRGPPVCSRLIKFQRLGSSIPSFDGRDPERISFRHIPTPLHFLGQK